MMSLRVKVDIWVRAESLICGLDKSMYFVNHLNMETNSDAERDTIAWFRVGIVATSAVLGLALFISGARIASYVFLGYALFGATVMIIFKTWRSSSEVDKVNKSNLKRMIRNTPRGILRFVLGHLAFLVVLAIGLVPVFLISNEFFREYEPFWIAYIFFIVGVSIGVFFLVGGFAKNIRQIISDVKAIRNAARIAKDRRAKE